MPDLPIDTLFIVGLLIASFVGKLLEGRSKNKNTTTKSQKTSKKKGETVEEKNLGDILRETFGEAIEPLSDQNSDLERAENSKKIPLPDLKERSARYSKFPVVHTEKMSLTEEKLHSNNTISTRQWLKNEALSSKTSLRRAFLVKEVLDQPPGLRRPGL